MISVAQGEVLDCTNPKLDLFTAQAGRLLNVVTLEFQIFSMTGAIATQIFPAVAGTRQPLDPTQDCPTGHRLERAHYVAEWTVPGAQTVGRYQIRWFFTFTAGGVEQTYRETFEVLDVSTPNQELYALVADIRDEGVTLAQYSNAAVYARLEFATKFIEEITGRVFVPTLTEFTLDGEGHGQLFLQEPIIAIDEVEITIEGITFTDQPIDLNDVSIYNRHITQNLKRPDDRDNPRISFKRPDPEFARLHALIGQRVFYKGKQNIRVNGLFGYTDFDGSPMGKTPDLIRYACKRLAILNLPPLGDADAVEDAENAGNVKRHKTRDQEIEYFDRTASNIGGVDGPFTGDQRVDNILMRYGRPMDIAVV